MKKLITFILLLIGILSFGSFSVYAEDVTYTFDEEKYQIIPNDLSGTEWELKTIDDIDIDKIEFLNAVPLLWSEGREDLYQSYTIDFISNNNNMRVIQFIMVDLGDAISISINYYDPDFNKVSVLDNWYLNYDMSDFGYDDYNSEYFSLSITGGEDSKNSLLIAFMTTLFTWQNPPTPTEPVIPEEPTDEPFLTSNEIMKLMTTLVIYIVALFVGMLAKSKLLIAMTGLLWLIPLVTIDSLIIKLFSVIILIISFMILLKERDDYYD
jgi:hypothetical protein